MKFDKTRTDCIGEASETQDGTFIAGHLFEQLMAFQDLSTKRWYMIDICRECGTPTVAFSDKFEFTEQAKKYPNVTALGWDLMEQAK